MIAVGLDPGTHTGFAIWDAVARRLDRVESMTMLEAMAEIDKLIACTPHADLVVIFEDARKRKIFGRMDLLQAKYGAAVREGAGAAKREATLWNDFLRSRGVQFIARKPIGTKLKAERFALLTGWTKRTNEHARDAAMIVHGLNVPILIGMLRAAALSVEFAKVKQTNKKRARAARAVSA